MSTIRTSPKTGHHYVIAENDSVHNCTVVDILKQKKTYHNALVFCDDDVTRQDMYDELLKLNLNYSVITFDLDSDLKSRQDKILSLNSASNIIILTDDQWKGLNVCDVTLIVNINLPEYHAYTHRSGFRKCHWKNVDVISVVTSVRNCVPKSIEILENQVYAYITPLTIAVMET
jgi:superfamily II DNA/RNA helicase